MQDIAAGDEITIAYEPDRLLLPAAERFCFSPGSVQCCLCAVCSRVGDDEKRESEARRKRLLEETKVVREIRAKREQTAKDNRRLFREAERLEPLLAEEGLTMELCFPLANTAVSAACK